MRSDVVHLAAAMLSGADYLLTWNYRRLANLHVVKRLPDQHWLCDTKTGSHSENPKSTSQVL